MTWWLWVLAVEYAVLGLLGLWVLIRDARERALWRRLALHAFTQHPIANTTPPTCTELGRSDWLSNES